MPLISDISAAFSSSCYPPLQYRQGQEGAGIRACGPGPLRHGAIFPGTRTSEESVLLRQLGSRPHSCHCLLDALNVTPTTCGVSIPSSHSNPAQLTPLKPYLLHERCTHKSFDPCILYPKCKHSGTSL